jgi:hypothetical protein
VILHRLFQYGGDVKKEKTLSRADDRIGRKKEEVEDS